MNRQELASMLSAQASPVAIAQWLRATFLPVLISRFNTDDVRKRLGLYRGERIPDNERNLTDVRNRVSLIIEYELARLSNLILSEAGETDLFWAYVVANRFPDLEVRKPDGSLGVRIEVKCLHSIAEEKAANFDTLRKDINPETDFVVVFLWEWAHKDSESFAWDRAPKLLGSYVFHAATLAQLRDHYWLNKPPKDLGKGYQGFDLRYAVNCKKGVYSEEEGNYGKLLRIWQSDFQYRPVATASLQDTEEEYQRFKQGVVLEGFWSLCDFYLPRLSLQPIVVRISRNGTEVGAQGGDFAFFAKSLVDNAEIAEQMCSHGPRYAVAMTDKYVCTGYELVDGHLQQRFKGHKPKLLSRDLFSLA